MPKFIVRWGVALPLVIGLSACATLPQIPMTPTQADLYNQCMHGHWSSTADTVVFGYGGYQYHQNLELHCQQYALTRGASGRPPPAATTRSPPAKVSK